MSPITDAGLVHLTGLINLQTLALARTQVTNNGVNEIQQALPSVQVHRRSSWNG